MITRRTAALVSLVTALGIAGLLAGLRAIIRFAEPSLLAAGAIPALLVASWCFYAAWRGRAWQRFGHVEAVRRMATRLSLRAEVARLACVAVGALLLVVAAARPQWGERTREVTREGIDVVFAVDLSRSMLAMDLAPSRLQAAVLEIDRLMGDLEGDRVGLVVFAADAVKQSPLTSDYGAIRHYLARVHPDHFSRQGTAIGRAIRASQDLLTGGGDDRFERATNQLIVVISDGEDRVTDPVAAAREAAEAGIRVYTVGMGTPDGARIPEHRADGSFRRWLTDRNDEVVVSQLMEDQLVEIAEVGGGDYRRYTTEGSVSTFVEQSIGAWDAEALSSALRIEYQERFGLFLAPGLVLLLLGTAIPRTRRRRRDTVALAAIAAATFGAACAPDQLPTRVDRDVAEAVALAAAGDVDAAREAIERAGGAAIEAPGFDYTAGWVEEQGEAWLEARDRYLEAIGAEAVPDQVRALFALGNVLLHEERYREAIERYQRALTLDPTHDGARRNLEIALRRLYPPCSALDDEFEDDDEAGAATLMPGEFFEGTFTPPGAEPTPEGVPSPEKVACGDDADWWRIPALGGAIVDLEVTFTRLRDDNGGPPLPDSIAPSAVRIALYGPDGLTPIAVDQGLDDGDTIPARRVTRTIEAAEIDPGLGPETDIYLEIEVDRPLEYEVELSITMTPPCYALEDAFEANDLATTAREVDNGPQQARACPGNADWYRFDLQTGDRLFVDVSGLQRDDGTPGAIDAAWFVDDSDTTEISTTLGPESPGLALDLAADDAPRTAWLRVQSTTEDDAGGYGFEVWHYPPCPEGNDRFEDNDTSETRAAVGGQDAPPPFRHLRLCEGDVDWFEVALPPMPEPEEGEPEPTNRPFSVLLTPDAPGQEIVGVVYDPTTGRPITATREEVMLRDDGAPLVGEVPSDAVRVDADGNPLPPNAPAESPAQTDTDDAGDAGDAGDEPEVIEPVIAGANLPLELESVVVVVAGDPGFYDLELPDTQQQQEQQQESEEGDEGEEGEDGEDSESNTNGEPQDDEQAEPEDGEDDESEDEGAPEDESAPEEDSEDETEADAAEAAAEERRAELLELLDSLEDDEVNLQIQQALQDLPPEEFAEPW